MVDFNESKDSYKRTIEESLNFSGKGLDFFVEVKAKILKKISTQRLPHIEKPRILDIGCGHGYLHGHLPSIQFEVVGVEVAADVLELARESNPDVSYISYDGNTLPFQPQSFDIAIAICVMHHVPPAQWNSFLEEMKRVVKAEGMVIIFEHNPYNPLTRSVVANNILDRDAVLLRPSDLEKRMIQSGFGVAKSRFFLFTPFASSFFRWVDKILGWCPLGAQYYTIATR